MKKLKYKIMAAALTTALLAGVSVPAAAAASDSDTVILRVCNWEEYIDEGGWGDDEIIDLESAEVFGENSLIDDFEEWYYETYGTRVKVEYSTFGTNEELYSQLTLGDTFDLVCPSDYMIMKLMKEGMLTPLSEGFFDLEDENNYFIKGVSPYIENVFESSEIDGQPWADYAAGYMWGIVGFLYNPEEADEEAVSTWNAFENPEFYRKITIKDNVRDAYFPALAIINSDKLLDEGFTKSESYREELSEIMNDTRPETIDKAEDVLKNIYENVYSFETDSGKADMVSGKVLINQQWSGDAVYAIDQAEEDGMYLQWAVPKECTNLWFDGWVMLKNGINGDAAKQHAAEAFINYLSRPDNAIRNMYYIGYTSVISGGDDTLIKEYIDWTYGADEDAEETVEYPIGYFFCNDNTNPDYVITTSPDQLKRQLSAQYPSQEEISRSAVMEYFDKEVNQNVNQMWINVRCFNLRSVTVKQWVTAAIVIAAVALMVLVFVFRHRIFKKRVPKGYRAVK